MSHSLLHFSIFDRFIREKQKKKEGWHFLVVVKVS